MAMFNSFLYVYQAGVADVRPDTHGLMSFMTADPDPVLLYEWCAMDPIKKYPSHVSIHLP